MHVLDQSGANSPLRDFCLSRGITQNACGYIACAVALHAARAAKYHMTEAERVVLIDQH